MEQEYSIKGIEKIINKVGKERLAKYYNVDINSDFESIITEDLKQQNVPNGLEVAFYFSMGAEEYNKSLEEGKGVPNEQEEAVKVYEQDSEKRAMVGIHFLEEGIQYDEEDYLKMISGSFGNSLYFFIDEPIRESELAKMNTTRFSIGGVHYGTLLMGSAYYEAHKSEINAEYPDRKNIEALDKYVDNFMNEFEDVAWRGGYGPRPKYTETDQIREEKAKNEKIILELTGKNSMDEISLKELISLRRRLEKEEKDARLEFEDKFAQKNDGERE